VSAYLPILFQGFLRPVVNIGEAEGVARLRDDGHVLVQGFDHNPLVRPEGERGDQHSTTPARGR